MGEVIENFIKGILRKLDVDEGKKKDLEKELLENFEEEKEELLRMGIQEEEAEKRIVERFGNPEKFKKRLLFIHGFGRFSENAFMDGIFGSIPIFLGILVILFYSTFHLFGFTIEIPNIFSTLLFGVSISISIIAYKKGFPARTFPWVGTTFVYLAQILLFFSSISKLYLIPAIMLAFLLLLSIYAIFKTSNFKRGLGLTLLFLLPLSISFAFYGSDEMFLKYKIIFQIIIGTFAILFTFLLLYFRLKPSYIFSGLGFILYTFSYLYIVLSPHRFAGAEKTFPLLLGYSIPILLLVTVPFYFFLKERVLD